MIVSLRPGMKKERNEIMKKLISMQYSRNELDFKRGTFRAKGDILEIYPSDESETAIRVEFWGDEIEKISEISPLTGKTIASRNHIMIFPNSHYVTTSDKMERAIISIEKEKEATIITSLVSKSEAVAECLSLSISSFIDESFSIYVSEDAIYASG